MARTILRPPILRTRETEQSHRSATWLELFYDLVFVVAVANVGGRLLDAEAVTLRQVAAFVAFFIPIWWAWAGFTFYADRYDTDDLGQRVLAVGQIVAIALMAASISLDAAESSVVFALSFVMARFILMIMYWRARRNVAETRDLVTGYLTGMSIELGFWLVSIFVPTPWRFWLWVVGLAVGFGTPYYYRKIQAKVPLDVSHLPERFGLFTILVLGESIAAVVAGLSHEDWTATPTTIGILGVMIASGLWWLYFDNLDGNVVRRRPDQHKAWKPTAWIYSHLPLAVSLVATGLGLEFLVAHHHGNLTGGERLLVAWSMAAALASMALLHVATESPDPTRRDRLRAQIRLGSAGLLVVIGIIPFQAMAVAILLTVIAGYQVGLDVVIQQRALVAADAETT